MYVPQLAVYIIHSKTDCTIPATDHIEIVIRPGSNCDPMPLNNEIIAGSDPSIRIYNNIAGNQINNFNPCTSRCSPSAIAATHGCFICHFYIAGPVEGEPDITYKPMPCHNELFTGREVYLDRLRRYFSPRDKASPRRCLLLYGLGGVGKTQICLKFVEDNTEQ